MSQDELTKQALKLGPDERLQLAERLLASFHEPVPLHDWEAAWTKEINARLADLDAGAPTIPFEDLLAELGAKGGRQAS